MPQGRLFAFIDWDDTLKVTNDLYYQISRKNAELVLSHLPGAGLTPADLVHMVHEIDLEKARRFGLRAENYPSSWRDCYRKVAASLGVEPLEEVARLLAANAETVSRLPQPDYPGAPELLHFLRRHQFEITIWTSGNSDIQTGKVERSGWAPLIDRLVVVAEKTPETLKEALGGRDPALCSVVGNSPRADVLPALAVGAKAIHVLQSTWGYDQAEIDHRHENYHPVSSLREVPALLCRLFSLPRPS
ncbi:MAG TPA: hypothetical protein GXX29_04560 [Firmicutes bacterium]|nr:hypothetical protein [Bacillota bacterium]